jgi:GntR family histidine utilization transcriptional repressor
MSAGKQKLPQFALIKQFLEQQISSGELSSGAKIPTEQSLADSFSVSRMTARRAVQELADMGMLTRTPGSGTFVAEPIKTVPMIAITNLVDAAKQSKTHSHRIISADAVQLAANKARLMGLMADTLVYQLNLLHLNNNRPVQWQQICVNRSLAPALLKQKMDKIDPNDYLQWVCTPTKSDYQVSSVLPSASQRRDLDLSHQDNASCLSVERRDWVGESVLSISTMLHPAEQFYLGDPLKDVKI